MPLSDEERAQLEALQAKEKEPPPPEHSRRDDVRVVIDLSDENAVERGIALGFLKPSDVDEGEEGEAGEGKPKGKSKGEGEGEGEETPKRKGYFKE